ncbi:MAG: type II toxin-antitoxin system RelE/ParE family toxin, partial [Candidatus Sulfotelmatobacter sp.]
MAETHPIFLGDSKAVIRGFSKSVKENFGGELDRLLDGETPLDSAPMGQVLPGVFELRDEDKDFWYRVLYYRRDGMVYVLH